MKAQVDSGRSLFVDFMLNMMAVVRVWGYKGSPSTVVMKLKTSFQ